MIVIQPAYGNATSIRNFKETLDSPVRFSDASYASFIAPDDLRRLLEHHPSGEAKFWAVTANQRSNFTEMSRGDRVLFTGDKHVQGVGRVGNKLVSTAFGNSMWRAHPDKGPYLNIYSVTDFERVQVPYQPLRNALGRPDGGDNFMGMRLIRDPTTIDAVIESLGLAAESDIDLTDVRSTERELSNSLRRRKPERFETFESSYDSTSREVVVHRVEAILVEHFRASFRPGMRQLDVDAVGVPDMYIAVDDEFVLVEAKAGASHRYVRQALGQILDYALSVRSRVDRIAVLLPERPAPDDLALLHHFGVDCVHRTRDDAYSFSRAPDPHVSKWMRTSGEST